MKIEKTAVIGLGTMGFQIAVVLARGGFVTVVVEVDEERLHEGLERIRDFLGRQEKKGKLSAEEREKIMARLVPTVGIAGAAEADFVVEAVFEDLEVKKKVFAELDRFCSPETILASNTSTLSVTALAAATRRPERCVGTHFLIPAALTPLVEMVRGLQTSEDTIRLTREFLHQCGKETVVVADAPAFVINRLYIPLINEAFYLLAEGAASAKEIDQCCQRGLGMPLGPLAAADASGLDVILACIQTLHRELGDKFLPCPLLVKLVRAGHLGRKTGKGVYNY